MKVKTLKEVHGLPVGTLLELDTDSMEFVHTELKGKEDGNFYSKYEVRLPYEAVLAQTEGMNKDNPVFKQKQEMREVANVDTPQEQVRTINEDLKKEDEAIVNDLYGEGGLLADDIARDIEEIKHLEDIQDILAELNFSIKTLEKRVIGNEEEASRVNRTMADILTKHEVRMDELEYEDESQEPEAEATNLRDIINNW